MKLGILSVAVGVISIIALVVMLVMNLIMGNYFGAVWGTIYTGIAGGLFLYSGTRRIKKYKVE